MSANMSANMPRLKITELELEALGKRGTDSQRQRYAAGVLAEDELLAVARAELFAPLNQYKRWHTFRANYGHHKAKFCRGKIDFATRDPNDLTHDEWESLAAIRGSADIAADHHWIARSSVGSTEPSVRVEPVAHWATCTVCGGEERRISVKVHIQWAGRLLTREYAL